MAAELLPEEEAAPEERGREVGGGEGGMAWHRCSRCSKHMTSCSLHRPVRYGLTVHHQNSLGPMVLEFRHFWILEKQCVVSI